MAERHILLFSRPSCRAFVSLPAAGIKWSFPCCPAAGPWVSVPNLLTKIPFLFENIGTRGHQSAFLAHFTYESLLWRRKTGTKVGGKSDIDPLSKSIILHIHLLYIFVVFLDAVCYYMHIAHTNLLLLILGSSLRANIPDNEPQLKMDLLRIPGKESPFCVSSAAQKGVFLL